MSHFLVIVLIPAKACLSCGVLCIPQETVGQPNRLITGPFSHFQRKKRPEENSRVLLLSTIHYQFWQSLRQPTMKKNKKSGLMKYTDSLSDMEICRLYRFVFHEASSETLGEAIVSSHRFLKQHNQINPNANTARTLLHKFANHFPVFLRSMVESMEYSDSGVSLQLPSCSFGCGSTASCGTTSRILVVQ